MITRLSLAACSRATGRNNADAVARTWVLTSRPSALHLDTSAIPSPLSEEKERDLYFHSRAIIPSKSRRFHLTARVLLCAFLAKPFAKSSRLLQLERFPRKGLLYACKSPDDKSFPRVSQRVARGLLVGTKRHPSRRSRVPTTFRRTFRGARCFPRRPHQCCRSARNDPNRHGRDTLSGFAHKAVTAR